jgi:hypothetical protein
MYEIILDMEKPERSVSLNSVLYLNNNKLDERGILKATV